MNTIVFLDTFGDNLSDEDIVLSFISKKPVVDSSELTVDLSGCILDYPATSLLVDYFISELKRCEAPRKLVLLFNISFPKRVLLKWYFFGSQLLPSDYHSRSTEDIESNLNLNLSSHSITLLLAVKQGNSEEHRVVSVYGQT